MLSIIKIKPKALTNYKAWLFILFWFVFSIFIGGVAGSLSYTLLSKYFSPSYVDLAVGFISYSFILLALVFSIKKFWKQKDALEALGMRGDFRWYFILWAVAGLGIFFIRLGYTSIIIQGHS